jgi:hypothetical protein
VNRFTALLLVGRFAAVLSFAGGAEVLHFVADVQTTDRHHRGNK